MGMIADLMVKVGANVSEFKTGMAEVNKGVDEAGSKSGKFGAVMQGAGLLALGAVTGVVAFGLAAEHHAEEAGQAAFELSEKFGLLPQAASAWIAVGAQLGVSGEQIGKGFQILSKTSEAMALSLAATGKVAPLLAEPYKKLGINVLDTNGHVKDANTLMLESADAFKRMKDGPEKAALAMKLFGKSGTDLIPVLNEGRAGIQELIDKGKESGAVMSGPQVEAAHKLFLEHKQLDSAINGVTTQIGAGLMPLMTTAMGFILTTAIPAVERFAGYFKTHLMPAITQIWSAFMTLLTPAITYIKAHFDSIKPVLIGLAVVVGIIIGVIVLAIGLVVIAVVAVVAAIVWFVKQNEDNLAKGLAQWNSFVGFVKGLPGKITSAASGMWNGIWGAFKSMLNNIVHAWNSLHFTVGGGTFAGVTIPSVTLGVPQIPSFHAGGTVPGVPGSNVLALLKAGEVVSTEGSAPSASAEREIHNHFHFENALITDGPLMDILANKLAARMRSVLGT